MGFHFPPHIERLRQQSNLEWDYQLPPHSNVVALPLGRAREAAATGVYRGKASIIRLDGVPPARRQEKGMHKRNRVEVFATVGTRLRLDGQDYVAVRIVALPNVWGGKPVVYWETHCAECGEAMEVFAPLGRIDLSRRCAAHAKRGIRVTPASPAA